MNKREKDVNEMNFFQKLQGMDNRAAVYTVLFVLTVAAAIAYALSDNQRAVADYEGDYYPVAYSAISGSDAEVSPSDVAERADSYLAQFREFDRTYCFDYWLQCQNILAEHPDYAPDESLTEQARADYEHYVHVVRRERERERAFKEKLVVCAVMGGCALIASAALGINRARRFILIQNQPEEYADEL